MNLIFLYFVSWLFLCLLCFYVMDIKKKQIFIAALFPPTHLIMWFCFLFFLFAPRLVKKSHLCKPKINKQEEIVYKQLFNSLIEFNLSPNDLLFLSNNSEYKNREQLLKLIEIGKKII